MLLPFLAIVFGLIVLVWSADKFVEGAAATSRSLGVSPLFIGMIVIGFGTSAPEMVVSAFAASQGNPGLALGNAYGSNIANIALVLGLTALLMPMTVQSQVLRRELPILLGATLLAGWQLHNGVITRLDAVVLFGAFFAFLVWSLKQSREGAGSDTLAAETDAELASHEAMTVRQSTFWLAIGLLFLIASSRLLVWGAVEFAMALGVDELIIGLTIVALGTSLPELAAALVAIRKKENDLALGNLLGSNLFNTLAVVGIAAAIEPISLSGDILTRDWALMLVLTLMLFVFAWRPKSWQPKRLGRINRWEGGIFVLIYLAYMAWLVRSVMLN
ncbi:MAG: calcium/sodium antiporter [Idiomarina sp.]|nr:calcium/sodium antiporter [Idiomarina sp.]